MKPTASVTQTLCVCVTLNQCLVEAKYNTPFRHITLDSLFKPSQPSNTHSMNSTHTRTHQCVSSQPLQEIEEFSAVSQVREHVFDGRLPRLQHITVKLNAH